MSIDELIKDRIDRDMLFALPLRARGQTYRRTMLVGEALWQALNSPPGDEEWERRIGELQADLEVFATAQWIDCTYLFLLYPMCEGVWEIRSVKSSPSIRALGLFVKKDLFIAANIALRESLGEWQSRQWRAVKLIARVVWRNLFHTYSPLITYHVNDVVSGARDGRYYRTQ